MRSSAKVISLLLCGTFALGGCSAAGAASSAPAIPEVETTTPALDEVPAAETAEPEPAPTEVTPSKEDLFVAAWRAQQPGATMSDEKLLEWANASCIIIDEGHSYAEMADHLVESGDTPETVAAFMATFVPLAVTEFCPQHQEVIAAYLATANEPAPATEQPNAAPDAPAGISPEFKAAMDAYEEFFDEYVAFMKRFQANPSDLNLLTNSVSMISRYGETMSKLEGLRSDLSGAELTYYLEVMTRINQNLLSIL